MELFPEGKSPFWQEQVTKGRIQAKVEELYKGCFNSTKLYWVDYDIDKIDLSKFYHNGPDAWPKMYAVDVYTGMFKNFETDDDFLKMTDAATCKINNLDKAYLYLYMCKKENTGVAYTDNYPDRILYNSILSGKVIIMYGVRNCAEVRDDAYLTQ